MCVSSCGHGFLFLAKKALINDLYRVNDDGLRIRLSCCMSRYAHVVVLIIIMTNLVQYIYPHREE